MARLIDGDSLEEKGVKFSDTNLYVPIEAVWEAPTIDAVEVVRCKDCKYSYYNKYCTNEQWKDNGATVTIEADDFCSYGERRRGTDGNSRYQHDYLL